MADVQNGTNSVLMTKLTSEDNTKWKLASCQTSYSISSNNSPDEIKTKCGPKTIPGVDSSEARLEGIVTLKSNDANVLDTVALRAIYTAGVVRDWYLAPKVLSAASDDMETHTFQGIVTQFDETLPTGGGTFSFSIKITSAITAGHYTYA